MNDRVTNELLTTLAAGKPPVIGSSESFDSATESLGTPGDAGATGPAGAARAQPGSGMNIIFFGFLVFFVILIFSQWSQSKKERRRKEEMLSGLSRHDRVQTIGGIIGTVAELSDNEVVLRVDEATNTRVRVSRGAIQAVLKKGRGAGSEAEPKPEQTEAAV